MIPQLRFLLPLLLCLLTAQSRAAVIWLMGSENGDFAGSSQSAVCAAWAAGNPYDNGYGTKYPRNYIGVDGGSCVWKTDLHSAPQYSSMSQVSSCPTGQTDNNGLCGAPKSACEQVKDLINGTPQATRWYSVPVGSNNATGAFCDSGCAANLAIANPGYYTDGKNNSYQRQIMYTGQSCTNEPNAPQQFTPEKAPVTPEKKPPCAASEGVMTSSSGTIACVPEGTPNSNPPIVKKETNTKTNADGSKETTDTITTRDPSTGVEQKTSTTTTKDANGNTIVVTSSSGTSGATNGGNPEKPGDSDFCQKNPNLDICTGKLNKEETQLKMYDELKKLTNPGDTNTDPLKNATHTSESENALKSENDKFTDAAKGSTDVTAANKSSWQAAMESGWFTAVPSSGCSPITGTVGGRTFTIDHCEKASQISQIMSYAMWFMLVVGTFVMFTGGQTRSS